MVKLWEPWVSKAAQLYLLGFLVGVFTAIEILIAVRLVFKWVKN